MDAAPDELRTSASALQRLGGTPAGAADLGPISPELALIDPELARRARELLPEPGERPTPRATAPPRPVIDEPPAPEPEVEPARRRRWARALVFAAVVFAAGAASGSVVAPQRAPAPAAPFEFQAAAPATLRQPAQHPLDQRTANRQKHRSEARQQGSGSASRLSSHRARTVWASNVLGVITNVSRGRVVLVWHRPTGSRRVILLRARGHHRSRVIYRGHGTRYADSAIQACAIYRYTLVSYDREGRRSTGVSSSLVTPGCA